MSSILGAPALLRRPVRAVAAEGDGGADVFHHQTHNYAFSVNNPSYDVRPLLGGIRVPTLVICEANDRITPLAESEEIAARIPDSRLEVFESSGHMPAVESSAESLMPPVRPLRRR